MKKSDDDDAFKRDFFTLPVTFLWSHFHPVQSSSRSTDFFPSDPFPRILPREAGLQHSFKRSALRSSRSLTLYCCRSLWFLRGPSFIFSDLPFSLVIYWGPLGRQCARCREKPISLIFARVSTQIHRFPKKLCYLFCVSFASAFSLQIWVKALLIHEPKKERKQHDKIKRSTGEPFRLATTNKVDRAAILPDCFARVKFVSIGPRQCASFDRRLRSEQGTSMPKDETVALATIPVWTKWVLPSLSLLSIWWMYLKRTLNKKSSQSLMTFKGLA